MGNLHPNAADGPFRPGRYGYHPHDHPPPNMLPSGPSPPFPPTMDIPPNLRDEGFRSASPRFGPGMQESQSYAQSPQLQRGQALEVRPTGYGSPQGNLPPDYPQVYAQQGYQRYPPQGYYQQGYPPQGYYPQEYPPQAYYPDHPQQSYPGHPGYPPPPQGYYQQGYTPSQYAPGQQPGSMANTAFCASCIACITCLLCSCCQGLLGVSPDQERPDDGYIPSDPVDVEPPTVSSGPS